jgi:hypothetical protein
MQTETGKTQGVLWGWRPVSTGYWKRYGNHDIDDPGGPIPAFTINHSMINGWSTPGHRD